MTEPTTPAPDESDLIVSDAPDASRYEARVGDDLAGFANYTRSGRMMVVTHTEVEPAYEGRGVGGTLVRAALDDVRAKGLQVVPVCPFFAGWIDRHPEYQDLVFRSTSRVDD